MDYVISNQLSLESDYPYVMKKNDKCYKDYKTVPKAAEGRRLQFGNSVLSSFSVSEYNKNKNKEKEEKEK